jgi:hypothetical protein
VADDLLAKKYDLYFIFSRIPGIMERYEAAAQKPLNVWRKNPTSKRWESKGQKSIPPEVLQRMRFRFLPELSRVLSPRSYRRKGGKGDGNS